ncbi:EI24 domain-containing protein [Fluviibacterium sp. DFM31]|uniref:EI24 domain-containing protein n=1 Tax=Meridianimarinicoccus marinus TaxID=3231483 RepID=A0ABV3L3R6_9RHOB
MIFSDFLKALGQLGDPRFRRVLLLGLGLTFGLLLAAYVATVWLVGALVPETLTLPFIGEVSHISDIASGFSLIAVMGLSVFLMVPVASAFTGLFLDDVADAVEDRHYPNLATAPRAEFLKALADSLKFLGVIVLANLLALALYAVFPPFAPFIFWGLNGFLLGREYFQMVAMRRLSQADAKRMRRRHSVQIWLAGALMAVPLTVPLVNLLVPILGAATFTHLYHRLRGAEGV